MPGKAIVAVAKGKAEIRDVENPPVKDGHVLVKVTAVGINPTDWKTLEWRAIPGLRIGVDYAGVVEEVGPGVTKFKKGDRIAGIVCGGNELQPNIGTFGEYTLARADLQIKTPDNITDEQAATLGVSTVTVGQGLYKVLGLPWPTSPTPTPFPILIHGGSTATGIYGIQYAKASGLTVIATSSPRNFELLKSLGADAVFDYNSPTAGPEIRALTQNKLTLAWDCTGSGGELVARALSDELPSRYAAIIPVDKEVVHGINPKVEGPTFHIGYDVMGEPYKWGDRVVEVKQDEVDHAVRFWETARELLESGKVRPIRTVVNQGGKGLEGVLKGLEELKNGNISAGKFVYTL
ncbi:alcohol dehydrogenase [Annulohypoxylon truncatum]|uniref:alcohol dehydrogenase n=1 Tax=Annulohypoxylon truncatum TaxID=327061 RepID=UPI002007E8AC|nr:alcohol dehydrogenase [Annulohypoxylon truncatum]KAI1209007.1 alcohol dehydrogenase [Annulohypoxylon truncatum]